MWLAAVAQAGAAVLSVEWAIGIAVTVVGVLAGVIVKLFGVYGDGWKARLAEQERAHAKVVEAKDAEIASLRDERRTMLATFTALTEGNNEALERLANVLDVRR